MKIGEHMQGAEGQASGRVILLVDDEPLVRMGIAMLLEELDHRVVQASSAKQALELLAENDDVDIIITDFRMPDMDGLEMIGQARQSRPAIPAILMTGYAPDDERFASLDFPRICKPFGISEIEDALEQSF